MCASQVGGPGAESFLCVATNDTVVLLAKSFLENDELRGPFDHLLADSLVRGRWQRNDDQSRLLCSTFKTPTLVLCDLNALLDEANLQYLVRSFLI